ncbi:hypothetical protein LWI29_022343 [Acer saccharum]|uniref:Uncharacterized protein n=1 Tax=Acer saccharum TaxID=4024 RepID=A0AA39T4X1_ACESA|nr:hypothetical protein LWI29_022343 [Acer saccharum]
MGSSSVISPEDVLESLMNDVVKRHWSAAPAIVSQSPTPITTAAKVPYTPALSYVTVASFSWDQDSEKVKAQVDKKGLLRLLGGWRSKELEGRFRTVFARKIDLELSRSFSSLDQDDDISLVLEIQELISLLTRV